MTKESVNSQFEFREHEGGVYRSRRTEPTVDGLREMEVWSRDRREWLRVDVGVACDAWWFGTPMSGEDVWNELRLDFLYLLETLDGEKENDR